LVGSSKFFRRWLRHRQIAFDTSFLIPLLEEAKQEGEIVGRLVRLIENKSILLVTSTLTLLEVLARPYQSRDLNAVRDYYGYLTRLPLLKLVAVTPKIADEAARLRAEYGFKTPDAIKLATGMIEGATLFLTRDRGFRKQNEVEIGVL